jgi:histidine triad (HIT) family protein
MSSIFTQIIAGEIPSHKVYEDERTFAFLDIHPIQPGHMLVVPKTEVDRLEDLSDEDYAALMNATRAAMHRVREVLGVQRACLKVEGFDVPHVHIHVIPCNTAKEFYNHPDPAAEPDHVALAAMAEKLAFTS